VVRILLKTPHFSAGKSVTHKNLSPAHAYEQALVVGPVSNTSLLAQIFEKIISARLILKEKSLLIL